AHYDAFAAEPAGESIGAAAAGEDAARRSRGLADEAAASLLVRATVDGRVLTAQPGSLAGQRVGSGETLLTLAGDGGGESVVQRSVRLFLPAGEMNRIRAGDEVAIVPPGSFSVLRLRLKTVEGETATLPQGLIARQQYKGIELPTFYSARVMLPEETPRMALGTAGVAKVFGARRSLAERAAIVVVDVVRAHVW
ncbi:MAG: hypothetical protein WBY53_16220, partial [Acidobacteriaceae bacterium]